MPVKEVFFDETQLVGGKIIRAKMIMDAQTDEVYDMRLYMNDRVNLSILTPEELSLFGWTPEVYATWDKYFYNAIAEKYEWSHDEIAGGNL
jgi:hypothetical protein